jgi:hypothetical protein
MTNDLLLFSGIAAAEILRTSITEAREGESRVRAEDIDLDASTLARAIKDVCFSAPYWDILPPPEGTSRGSERDVAFRQSVRDDVAKSLGLLRNALLLDASGCDASHRRFVPPCLASTEGFGALMAKLAQNSIGTEFCSPAAQYLATLAAIAKSGVVSGIVNNMDSTSSEAGETHAAVAACVVLAPYARRIRAMLERHDDAAAYCTEPRAEGSSSSTTIADAIADVAAAAEMIPNFEGSGLFQKISIFNHSCVPNATVDFLDRSNVATVSATCAVGAGNEVCISYIPLSDSDDECSSDDEYDSDTAQEEEWGEVRRGKDNGEEEQGIGRDRDKVARKERWAMLYEWFQQCRCTRCIADREDVPLNGSGSTDTLSNDPLFPLTIAFDALGDRSSITLMVRASDTVLALRQRVSAATGLPLDDVALHMPSVPTTTVKSAPVA